MMSWQRINDNPSTTITNHNRHHQLEQPIVNQPSMSHPNNRPRSRPDDIFTAEEIDNCYQRLTPLSPRLVFLTLTGQTPQVSLPKPLLVSPWRCNSTLLFLWYAVPSPTRLLNEDG